MKTQSPWLFELPPQRERSGSVRSEFEVNPEYSNEFNGEFNGEFSDIISTVSNTVSSAIEAAAKLLTLRIEDRTALTPKSKRQKLKRGTVYALVLHQMAFSRGNDVKKYDSVTSHFIITPDGKIAQLHPVSAYLYASNGFNKHSVAVEFAGNFPNTKGKCWQPKPPAKSHGCHKLTPAQIVAGRYLIQHLIRTIGLTHVLAHRQSSASRANDPGPDTWYYVGQWAVDTLGLKDGGPGFKVGDGNPIPDAWRNWGKP